MPVKDDWTDGVDIVDAAALNDVADAINANETAVAARVLTSRTVSAGTGLTGGGDLSTNRTLAADFGSGSGKICQGNDSRLSDTRTPTDNTVSTAKLQDGAVNSAKIADGSIVDGDISGAAAIALSKLATGRVVGSNNGTATSLTVWVGTEAQYAAIGSKDSATVYMVTP